MKDRTTCPNCRTLLPQDAPQGLCPRCLGALNLAEDSVFPGAGNIKTQSLPTPEELARLFPQLEILELIGHGGMGAVYKARQKQLDRVVALKILPPGTNAGPAFEARFVREARALAKLNHPGVVTLYEFGQNSSLFFFLMEFVDGVNLRQLIQGGRISSREALTIVPQICDALQYAHDQGIVHRDIKPENILVDRHGRVKVADFGLAKLMDATHEPALGSEASLSSTLSEAGKVMGTPQYMAPEQREHPTEVDHRADIYSLGVVFYQMLTGELPGKTIEPPSSRIRGMQIDVRLDEVVLRAMERKPERRYQQASVLKTQVETIAATPQKKGGTTPFEKEFTWARLLANPTRIIRWVARVLGTGVILAMFPFVLAEGLPPIARQPEGVQLTFFGGCLLCLGFIVGWRRDGSAALLIAAGWATITISENQFGLSLLHGVLAISGLYAYCWWSTRGRKTTVIAVTIGVFAFALVLGRLFCPVNVFIKGQITDAFTGQPIAEAQIRIREKRILAKKRLLDYQANKIGEYQFYQGLYDEKTTLLISAPGYRTMETALGPRQIAQRHLIRNFQLVQTNYVTGQILPVVVKTEPQSGSADVNPEIGELKVRFSQLMDENCREIFSATGARLPFLTGPASLSFDGCTIVMPVSLQPGTVYAVWINGGVSQAFRNINGYSAAPYLLIFETRKK